jgi:hypothetical protein
MRFAAVMLWRQRRFTRISSGQRPIRKNARNGLMRYSAQFELPTRLSSGRRRTRILRLVSGNGRKRDTIFPPSQLADFRDLVNTYQKTLFATGISKERFEVPEKGPPISRGKRASTITRDLLREAIHKEQTAKALMAH